MEYKEHVEKLLEELESDTGIRFSIDDNNNNQSETIKKLSRLIHRFKGDENRGFFFRQFLLGQLSREEIGEKRLLYHMDQNQPWAVFLIAFAKSYEPYALRVISSLFAPGADHTVEMDRTHLVVVRQLKTVATDEEVKEMAEAIVGTLGTEAMLSVKVSYDRCCEDLSGLPLSYQHCNRAMEIGRLFMEGQSIFGYHELGLGKLVFSLDPLVCREYLEDHLGNFDFRELDPETRNTIRVFFDSGLSIAETARSLYVHRNTLVYRIDKLQKQTGLDIRRFEDAITMNVAMLMDEYLKRYQEDE